MCQNIEMVSETWTRGLSFGLLVDNIQNFSVLLLMEVDISCANKLVYHNENIKIITFSHAVTLNFDPWYSES